MVRIDRSRRLRVARGSRGVVPSLGRVSICVLLARPLRQSVVGCRKTAERGPRRRRGRGRVHGSPGLLYEDARCSQSAMSCASLGDAARPLVCGQESLVRGRVSGESAALYLWRAALLLSCRRRCSRRSVAPVAAMAYWWSRSTRTRGRHRGAAPSELASQRDAVAST